MMRIQTTMWGLAASPLATCMNVLKQQALGHSETTGISPTKHHSVVARHSMLVVQLLHPIMAITGTHHSQVRLWIRQMPTLPQHGVVVSGSSTRVRHSLQMGMTLMCGMEIHGRESHLQSRPLSTPTSTMGVVG